MNILLIYPKYPDTFWSFKHALKFVAKKAANPPLGLITIASMLPVNWEKKLVDLNIESLKDRDIHWADYVFISAMNIQQRSVSEVVDRCNKYKTKVVAGGPLFTAEYQKFPNIDYFILNEAEITLPEFLNDLDNNELQKVYQTENYANLNETPLPDYSLIKSSKYNSLSIQFTRGCPFNCEFCDITALLGHKVRIKTSSQIIKELNNIYDSGWRKSIFFVDDNFIGNKRILKNDLLPKIIDWMYERNFPFYFTTEVSIDLADDEELMKLLVQAGFENVFVGIETPNEESLSECNKVQNKNRSLVQSVHKIQEYGIEVSGGFIVGFDSDQASVFQNQIDFIKNSGIITAMVGLLNAPKKTQLYKRLKKENRIVKDTSGNNTDFTLNFKPKMNENQLINGYKKIIRSIYSGESFYKRVTIFLKRFTPSTISKKKISIRLIFAFLKSIVILGVFDKFRKFYWELIFWSLLNRPQTLTKAVTYSIYGYHFRKIFRDHLN